MERKAVFETVEEVATRHGYSRIGGEFWSISGEIARGLSVDFGADSEPRVLGLLTPSFELAHDDKKDPTLMAWTRADSLPIGMEARASLRSLSDDTMTEEALTAALETLIAYVEEEWVDSPAFRSHVLQKTGWTRSIDTVLFHLALWAAGGRDDRAFWEKTAYLKRWELHKEIEESLRDSEQS